MIETLVVILIIATFLIGCFIVVEDIDMLIEEQLAEAEALCSGCQRHFIIVGCPVHDTEARKAA